MPPDDRGNEHDELIERLTAQAAAAADGRIVAYESDGLTPGVQGRLLAKCPRFRDGRDDGPHLLRERLPEEMPALDVDENSAWHIDVLGYDKPELYLSTTPTRKRASPGESTTPLLN